MIKASFYIMGMSILLFNIINNIPTYHKKLKAIIINENKDELIEKLDRLILNNSVIPSQSNFIIQLNSDNKIIRSRIYSPPSNQHNLVPDTVKSFIENEIQFTTLKEDALISQSVWYHIYIKPDL